MKASKFSDAQKAFILKQGADGMPVADICRKAGISQALCSADHGKPIDPVAIDDRPKSLSRQCNDVAPHSVY